MATAFKDSGLQIIDPADMPDQYAVPGYGRCMSPVFNDGDLLVCDKNQKPEAGDEVIVHFRREYAQLYGVPGWVKRLGTAPPSIGTEGLIIVDQLSPPRRFTVPSCHISAIHKIVGTAESCGSGTARFRPRKS